MGLLSRITSKVRQTITFIEQSLSGRSSAPSRPQPTSQFSASSPDIQNTANRIESYARAMEPHLIPREVSRELAREAQNQIRDALDPISRTGNAKRSIQVRESAGPEASVVTDGSAPYLEAIEEGAEKRGVPPVQELLKWMNKKPEFSGLSENKRRNVAYAIQTTIKSRRGQNKTGRSDITNLPPRGTPQYEFTKEALRHMEDDIRGVGDAIGRGLE